jgi:hypothetical protein
MIRRPTDMPVTPLTTPKGIARSDEAVPFLMIDLLRVDCCELLLHFYLLVFGMRSRSCPSRPSRAHPLGRVSRSRVWRKSSLLNSATRSRAVSASSSRGLPLAAAKSPNTKLVDHFTCAQPVVTQSSSRLPSVGLADRNGGIVSCAVRKSMHESLNRSRSTVLLSMRTRVPFL